MKKFKPRKMTSKQVEKALNYFVQIMVTTVYHQHLQNEPDLSSKGAIVGYDLNAKEDYLDIKYENGEVWRYQNLEHGAEDMSYKLVENNK